MPFCTGNKRHCGVGCCRGHSLKTVILCSFADSGFVFSDCRRARPCKSSYHSTCIRAGVPFTSRRRNSGSLVLPDISVWPTFVCKACTVRAVLNRELTGPEDWKLLCFERKHLLDMAHSWAEGTHKLYQGKIHFLQWFGQRFGLQVLMKHPITKPPISNEIPLTWAQLSYSLQMGRHKSSDGECMTLTYGPI
jgi:hypothetical protein